MLYSKYVKKGTPTIVFIAGLGDSSDTWEVVQSRLSREFSTFSYDRAGTGRSQSVSGPRSCVDLAEELAELLRTLDVPHPYILAGHSFGGLIARLYASRYPHLVSGLVLIDAAAEYKELAYEEALPDKLLAQNKENYSNPLMNRERIDKPLSYKQAAESVLKSDLDIVILIRGLPGGDNGEWPFEEIMKIDQKMQENFQRLSTSSKCRMAAGSDHYIHQDEPNIVIEEIAALIKGEWTAQ
jgi:pimeloyl-ACP methyl ester carboxylesterase